MSAQKANNNTERHNKITRIYIYIYIYARPGPPPAPAATTSGNIIILATTILIRNLEIVVRPNRVGASLWPFYFSSAGLAKLAEPRALLYLAASYSLRTHTLAPTAS